MGLKEYWTKRDFGATPEPRGKVKPRQPENLGFVIQKHAASRLHYDFRLELDGTLKSWAVPKGPSLDPKDKRLAVHVEDHPIEYGGFEGVIPPKQYGAGSVIIWDRGSWEPVGDAIEGYRKGKLKFRLHGEKLQGGWTLARMGGRAAGESKENWLLIKENDESARSGPDADIVDTQPLSVESGRDVSELAMATDRVWHSKAKSSKAEKKPPRLTPPPEFIPAQLATLVDDPPVGPEWVHEIKYDGYRMLCRIDGGQVRLISRNEKDWTQAFPTIVAEAQQLPLTNGWLDGEVVSLDTRGISSFQALQNALEKGRMAVHIVYYVFDLLFLNGQDLTTLALSERKSLLANLLQSGAVSQIRYSEHMEIEGEIFYRYACQHGLEGIISKRRDLEYTSRRTKTWIKVKCLRRQEFVIVGYTEPGGARTAFGALLLGVYERDGRLVHCGKVGTGFNESDLQALLRRLKTLEQKTSALTPVPKGAEFRNVHWVKPELVAEVGFSEWTAGGSLRHPSFVGLREDKPAAEVVREETVKLEAVETIQPPTSKKTEATVAGVRLSHADKILFSEAKISKLTLAEFYARISQWILPHLVNRPLTLVRCPEGGQGKCFYQKHANATVPTDIGRIEIQEKEGTVIYMNANTLPAVIGLVQMGVLEFHTWGSYSDKPECPNRITFDLDPDPQLAWEHMIFAAKLLRARLDALGLKSFLKTTGSKGLHVVIPLLRKHSWDEVKLFAKAVAEEFARADPQRFTAKMTKSLRAGKIYIDYLRNSREATAIAAYSTRAKPHAPVSTPLFWEELDDIPRSDFYTVKTLITRLESLKKDPWADYAKVKQSLTVAMKKELGV